MPKVVKLQTFYNAIDKSPATIGNEVGHFNIFKIEDILLPKNKQVSYSRRDFFKVSLITGHNILHYADQSIEINGSALVFTNPLIPYFWEKISEQQEGYLCVFTEAFFNRYGNIKEYPVFQNPHNAIIPVDSSEVIQYQTLFSKMFHEIQSDYVYRYDLLRNLLLEVVHEAQKSQPAKGKVTSDSNAAERIAGLFKELLERQFPIELSSQVLQLKTPSDFARQLNVHVNHLNKALKEVTHQTTTQLIDTRMIDEAKILLRSTTWSISDIAFSLGFEEPNHFSYFFKARTQSTPKQFRQLKID